MKAFAVVMISFFLSNAHASMTATRCSNSDGSVTWESGYSEDLINLKYSNFVEGILTLSLDQVSIHFENSVTIEKKSARTCSMAAQKRVYAGKVKIEAADKNPDVLRGQFPLNKVETEVICTFITNTPLNCPSEQ